MNQAYQLICCDLDGTLLNEKDEVSEMCIRDSFMGESL